MGRCCGCRGGGRGAGGCAWPPHCCTLAPAPLLEFVLVLVLLPVLAALLPVLAALLLLLMLLNTIARPDATAGADGDKARSMFRVTRGQRRRAMTALLSSST